jgi:hypothetical protein
MLKNGQTNSSVPKKTARDIKLSRVPNCADARKDATQVLANPFCRYSKNGGLVWNTDKD